MKILYFARVREDIGKSEEDVLLPENVKTVGALLAHLSDQSEAHQQALADKDQIRIAVNQEYVDEDHPVTNADEVAIFPPMTGG